MSSNPVDQEQEYSILQRLKAVEDALREFRTPQKQGSDVVRITRSGVVLQTATVPTNSGGYMGIAPLNGDGKPTFNDIESLFYQDTDNDEAHRIGSYLNGYKDRWDLEITREISDDTVNCDFSLYYFNHDTVSHTLYWHAQARYVLNNS